MTGAGRSALGVVQSMWGRASALLQVWGRASALQEQPRMTEN
jgi:hypothetical protein